MEPFTLFFFLSFFLSLLFRALAPAQDMSYCDDNHDERSVEKGGGRGRQLGRGATPGPERGHPGHAGQTSRILWVLFGSQLATGKMLGATARTLMSSKPATWADRPVYPAVRPRCKSRDPGLHIGGGIDRYLASSAWNITIRFSGPVLDDTLAMYRTVQSVPCTTEREKNVGGKYQSLLLLPSLALITTHPPPL